MFQRQIADELKKLAQDYPVVTVIGPRQSGKTTLVQYIFPKKPYANLEDPDIRNLAMEDPRGFLEQYPEGAVLDEIQRTPELLSYIRPLA
jgi:predicted AAA+ superfamily ATPase